MTTPQNMSRKRPAPGTSPIGYQQPPPLTDEQFFDWGSNGQPGQPGQPYQQQIARRPIQDVTRPDMNRTGQVIPRTQWMNEVPEQTWSDDIDELVAKAQVAKKEAQARRKQIPPFVMKLHSFLENPKNTDLIRWADDGKSFIVLNEDEFANNLIPELFKHSNYASFVRQLNMYGFHKKVGLSDNSMRASERKVKSPSEYWNPFFRRGYPDLLWLIQKPKNQTNRKRGKSEEPDEDEFEEPPRPQLALGPQPNNSALTSEQFQTVQRELMMIRRQQSQITAMLGQLKREHDALVDQANDYQDKHSRHEQSINAILTFLATLYHRSLQNHEGAQDIAKMFAQTLAQDKSGNLDNLVFDLPDTDQKHKRPRLMITDGSDNLSPSTAASPLTRRSSHMRSPQSAHVEEIFDPEIQPQNYQSPAQHDMMSLIHNTNARNSANATPVQDFNHVLNDIETSSGAPVSAAQRENMVRILNDQARRQNRNVSQGSGGNQFDGPRANYDTKSNTKQFDSPSTTISSPRPQSQSQSLTSPRTQSQFDAKLANTSHDLDNLAQLQAAQDKSVENLTNLLQPLSPTGSIPGIGDGQDVPPPPLNIDDFLNSTHDYFTEFPENNDFTLNNYNNGYDFTDDDPLFGDVDDKNGNDKFLNVQYGDDGKRVESLASSSEAPTPQNDGDGGDWMNGGGSNKRRKAE